MKKIMQYLYLGILFFCLLAKPAQAAESAPFRLHMIDVGQGLSVLVEAEDHWLLFDGGGRKSSSKVVSYLKEQGIERLDYVIASHYDEDHISGLVGALHVFGCDTVLEGGYEADTDIYRSFQNTAADSGAQIKVPVVGEEYALGTAAFQIVAPDSYEYETENDRSIGIRLTYGDISCLICGDAQEESESSMADSGLELASDLYVVNHHGSANASTFYFLNAVSPEYAMLSCGQNNTYGHPAAEAMERIQQMGCALYRTDQQGTILVSSDGTSLWFNVESCQDWSAGAMTAASRDSADIAADSSDDEAGSARLAEGTGDSSEVTYICNKNSMKFHYPYCDSVAKMKEKNKLYSGEDRDTLIAQGYEPCKNCNP